MREGSGSGLVGEGGTPEVILVCLTGSTQCWLVAPGLSPRDVAPRGFGRCDHGRGGPDLWPIVEAALWIAQTGCRVAWAAGAGAGERWNAVFGSAVGSSRTLFAGFMVLAPMSHEGDAGLGCTRPTLAGDFAG